MSAKKGIGDGGTGTESASIKHEDPPKGYYAGLERMLAEEDKYKIDIDPKDDDSEDSEDRREREEEREDRREAIQYRIDNGVKQREVELAEFELRIRKYVLELVEPTVQKCAALSGDVMDIQDASTNVTKKMGDLQRIHMTWQSQVDMVEEFRRDLSKWDMDRQVNEAKLTEEINTIKQKLTHLQFEVERKDNLIQANKRCIDRTEEQTRILHTNINETQNALQAYQSRIQNTIQMSQTTLEVKMLELETKTLQMSDDLFGGEAGNQKVKLELEGMKEYLDLMKGELKKLQADKATAVKVDELKSELDNSSSQAHLAIGRLKEQITRQVNDLNAQFKTATSSVIESNVAVINDFRRDCEAKISTVEELSRKIEASFNQDGDQKDGDGEININALNLSNTALKELEAKIPLLEKDLDDLANARRLDIQNSTNEFKTLKKRISGAYEASDDTCKGVEHIIVVMGMILEIMEISGCLDSQDEADRRGLSLFGFKDKDGVGGGGGGAGGATGRSESKSIKVDPRCLSCSNQSQQVIAGFKLACLQYHPSQVIYREKNWERAELLKYRVMLVDSSHQQINLGPGMVKGGTKMNYFTPALTAGDEKENELSGEHTFYEERGGFERKTIATSGAPSPAPYSRPSTRDRASSANRGTFYKNRATRASAMTPSTAYGDSRPGTRDSTFHRPIRPSTREGIVRPNTRDSATRHPAASPEIMRPSSVQLVRPSSTGRHFVRG